MLKSIKKYSLVALVSLVMMGCGGSGDGDSGSTTSKNISQLSTFSDAEKLAYYIANKDKTTETGQNDKKSRLVQTIDCVNGGTQEVTFPVESSAQMTQDIFPSKLSFIDCVEDGETTTGTMNMAMTGPDSGTITYLTDFIVEGGEDEVFIKKGGTVTMHKVDGWEELTINLTSVFNGITHAGENLVYRGKDLPDGGDISFPVSGKEKIGDSSWFNVDANYDASKTPFKTNSNGKLTSGLFKYLDDKNHEVEIEVIGQDVIAVRVNENGDGAFTNDEKSIINLAK